ncbi:hypothetical protein F5Y11DRAFT_326212 [Daldinia sp. FL1419]|nr:hypothetical protein F5Y11DRAFT_326212 [Daldinia sp. FL1419]
MENWPQELYDNVASFYLRGIFQNNPAFLTLATVCRKFQNSVESYTFQSLLIDSTESKLNDLERILTPRRRKYLQSLAIKMVLPPYPIECITEFETDQDRRANNEIVTAGLRRVFCLIASLYGQDEDIIPMLHLTIIAPASSSDKGVRPFLPKASADDRIRIRPDLNWQRYQFSLIDLSSDLSDFPDLPCVQKFSICDGRRNWNPRVAMLLSTKMSKASMINWFLDRREDDWGRYYGMERKYRDDLVKSIMSADFPRSTTRFCYHIAIPWAHNRQKFLPQFVASGENDPVSSALRHLTRNCTNIHIVGPVHSTFFDPLTGIRDGDQQCWKDVRVFKTTLFMRSPEGKWYFKLKDGVTEDSSFSIPLGDQLPPGYGDTKEELEKCEEYYYRHMILPKIRDEPERVIPDSIELNALFAVFARACCRLPVLKEASIEVVCSGIETWQYEVGCLAPGTPFPKGKKMHKHDTNSWRVYFLLHQWKPSEATIEELKMIGRSRTGCDPVFLWGVGD